MQEENDFECTVAQVSFVIDRDLADQYGTRFVVHLDEKQVPVVEPMK